MSRRSSRRFALGVGTIHGVSSRRVLEAMILFSLPAGFVFQFHHSTIKHTDQAPNTDGRQYSTGFPGCLCHILRSQLITWFRAAQRRSGQERNRIRYFPRALRSVHGSHRHEPKQDWRSFVSATHHQHQLVSSDFDRRFDSTKVSISGQMLTVSDD